MNTATIKNVAPAKNGSPAIYCQSKSGNIYKFRTPVPADRAPAIIAKMKTAGVINIAHWIKLKEGTFTPKPAKAPRPEYKEVVVKAQAARIRELQAQVFNLKAQLVDQVAGLQAEICAMAEDQAPSDAALEAIVAKQFDAPSDAVFEEMSLDRFAVSLANKMHKRSAAAKKGWATRRANAQQVAS